MGEGLTVAVIPARGGSKGIPGKNLRAVGGVPLVVRAVRAAQSTDRIDLVFVSTDDAHIAAVGGAAGAEVITRPLELSGDLASSESALLHALDQITETHGPVRTLVFLQATSPFIDSRALNDAIASVADGELDVAFSAFETYGFLWAQRSDGRAAAVNHSASTRPRRQDREPHYMETGAFYVMDAAGFRNAQHRFFGRIGIAEVPEASAIEIDDPAQLDIASALAPLFAPTESSQGAVDVDAIVTDFDGVHTDDTALVGSDGKEYVRVSRSDGMGVSQLRAAGIAFLILSTEANPVVTARASKLRVPVLQNITDKAAALRAWAQQNGHALDRTAYLGNDINDLSAMALVGWPVAVADAHPDVVAAARIVLRRRGGDGAVRELIDRALSARTPVL
jgi:YrbI family 3-deoxy-D-manno-octulosonate 8-phosphate phosphatase